LTVVRAATSRAETILASPRPAPVPAPTPTPTPTPAPPTTYDGSWTGGGTGSSSISTAATIDLTYQVSNGTITTLSASWRINTAPGTLQSSYCGGTGSATNLRIENGSFVVSREDRIYSSTFRGTFTSPGVASGTAQFTRQSGAEPWCASATINWTAARR
jgi:hypothetical protein